MSYSDDDDHYVVRPNKSEIKREMAAILAIAESLIRYRRSELERVGVPDLIIDQILEAAKMSSDSGKNRHLKLIAKHLRELNFSDVQSFMEDLKQNVSLKKKTQEPLEKDETTIWFEKLAEDVSGDVLEDFLQLYPNVDRQQFRTLLRNFRKADNFKKKDTYGIEIKKIIQKFSK